MSNILLIKFLTGMSISMSFREGFLEYPDRVRVRYRLSDQTSRVTAVLVHGLGERLEMYDYLYPYFERAGIALNAVELRGHGDSGGEHKYIRDFGLYIRDLKRFLYSFLKNRTTYLMGHSAGAMVVLRAAEDRRLNVGGLVLTSPLIEMRLNRIERMAIPLFSIILPHLVVPDKEENFYRLTHDEAKALLLLEESRRTLFGVKLGFMGALFRVRRRFLKDSGSLREIPSLVFLADKDIYLNVEKIENIMRSIYADSDKLDIVHCKGCFHALLLERERLRYAEKIINWMLSKKREHERLWKSSGNQ
jgi:alpha-beta hydrolase superfamily lysophospholipase